MAYTLTQIINTATTQQLTNCLYIAVFERTLKTYTYISREEVLDMVKQMDAETELKFYSLLIEGNK